MRVFIDYRSFWGDSLINKETDDIIHQNFRNSFFSLDLEKNFFGYCIYDKYKEQSFIYKFNFYRQFINKASNINYTKVNLLNYLHQLYFNLENYNLWIILDLDDEDYKKLGEFKKFLLSEPVICSNEKIQIYNILSEFYFEFQISNSSETLVQFLKNINDDYSLLRKIEKLITCEYILLALTFLIKEEKIFEIEEIPLFEYEDSTIEREYNSLFKAINSKFNIDNIKEKIQKIKEEIIESYENVYNNSYELIYKNSLFRNYILSLNFLNSKIKKSNILDTAFFKEDKNSNRTKLNYVIKGKRNASLEFISSFLDLIENKKEKREFYKLFSECNNLRSFLMQNDSEITFKENEKYLFYYQDIQSLDIDLSEIFFEKKSITIEGKEFKCNVLCYPYSEKIENNNAILVLKEQKAFFILKNEIHNYLNCEKYFIKSIVPLDL